MRKEFTAASTLVVAGTNEVTKALTAQNNGVKHQTPAEALGMIPGLVVPEVHLPGVTLRYREISGTSGASLIDLNDPARKAARALPSDGIVHLSVVPSAYAKFVESLGKLSDPGVKALAEGLRVQTIPAIVIGVQDLPAGEKEVHLRGFAKKRPADALEAPREPWDFDMDGNGFSELTLVYETMATMFDPNVGAEAGTILGAAFGATAKQVTSQQELATPLTKEACESHVKPNLVIASRNLDGKPYDIVSIFLRPDGVYVQRDDINPPVRSSGVWTMEAKVVGDSIQPLAQGADYRVDPDDPTAVNEVKGRIAVAGLLRTAEEVATANVKELGAGVGEVAKAMIDAIPDIAQIVGEEGTVFDAGQVLNRKLKL